MHNYDDVIKREASYLWSNGDLKIKSKLLNVNGIDKFVPWEFNHTRSHFTRGCRLTNDN